MVQITIYPAVLLQGEKHFKQKQTIIEKNDALDRLLKYFSLFLVENKENMPNSHSLLETKKVLIYFSFFRHYFIRLKVSIG